MWACACGQSSTAVQRVHAVESKSKVDEGRVGGMRTDTTRCSTYTHYQSKVCTHFPAQSFFFFFFFPYFLRCRYIPKTPNARVSWQVRNINNDAEEAYHWAIGGYKSRRARKDPAVPLVAATWWRVQTRDRFWDVFSHWNAAERVLPKRLIHRNPLFSVRPTVPLLSVRAHLSLTPSSPLISDSALDNSSSN